VDKPKLASLLTTSVGLMKQLIPREDVQRICQRLRMVRERKGLTLLDVERRSGGEISAVALGSYERGHRNVSLSKLLQIAKIYELPISEILTERSERVETGRFTFDLRKIVRSQLPESATVVRILQEIAVLRGDWNGEVMSIRAVDIANFQIFSGLSPQQISVFTSECTVARSK
jgi:transcriptional regulator with XRE-family HTH domain